MPHLTNLAARCGHLLMVVAIVMAAAIGLQVWPIIHNVSLDGGAASSVDVERFLSSAREIDELFVVLVGEQTSGEDQSATRKAIKANLIAQNTRLDLIRDRVPAAAKKLSSDYSRMLVELDGLLKYDASLDEITRTMLKLVSMKSELSQALVSER